MIFEIFGDRTAQPVSFNVSSHALITSGLDEERALGSDPLSLGLPVKNHALTTTLGTLGTAYLFTNCPKTLAKH